MYSFDNDYSEGAHESILQTLAAINTEQVASYGEDHYCDEARALIRREIGRDSDVYFLVGGTQANATVISALLRPHQGVISSDVGHINTHESGAIEATGHKVLTLPSAEGKITAAQIEELAAAHRDDPVRAHCVQPGMVYLSHPTETGTIYSRREMEEIAAVCRRYGLPLFVDGARLGCALASPANDLSLPGLAELADVFYIGGTKMGALFGEAVVVSNPSLVPDFLYLIKQRGGRLAKGWLLGVQFGCLFRDGLYYRLAAHANAMAARLSQGITALDLPLLAPTQTNQVFPILPDGLLPPLSKNYGFQVWDKPDEAHTAIRLVTSWATRPDMVDAFLADLRASV